MERKYFKNQIKDVVCTLITVIIMSITLLNHGFLVTLPIAMILAFCLFFIDYKIWWMIITTFIVHIILGMSTNSFLSIFYFLNNIIEIAGGYLVASCIKRFTSEWKNAKFILLSILSVIICMIAISSHRQSNGTPAGYLEAKNNVSDYIEKTYNNELEVTAIHYNSKMSEYIVNVGSKNDSRDEGSIFYLRGGNISDDYHYRIESNQGEMIGKMLKMIINQKTEIAVEDMSLDVRVTLPYSKYTKRDTYSGLEPISVRLTINPKVQYYESKEAFSKEANNILKILNYLNYNYESIEIQSFLADGNTTYSIVIDGPIGDDILENTISIVQVIEHKK